MIQQGSTYVTFETTLLFESNVGATVYVQQMAVFHLDGTVSSLKNVLLLSNRTRSHMHFLKDHI